MSTQQLINIEEKPLGIKLSNPAVLQQLRVFGEETNSHERESVIVSLIGKQKTYKSTHANLLFGTNFPKGMLGMQQTTKGILVESSVIEANSNKLNLHCLDYEGFGSTGRDLSSDEEKALDNKLMLLAYSISNIVIFSMHASEVTTFREFSQLMKMCVKGMKSNDQSKKPILIIFINVSFGDKNTLINTVLNGGVGKTQEEIRRVLHEYGTQSLLFQNDFKECKLYFSEVIVQTLYPNQMGNETEGFIIDHLKQLLFDKSFTAETQDSTILFNEERWNGTVSSINSNEQIEFASDVLGRMSENICSNKCELLKREFFLKSSTIDNVTDFANLKLELIHDYWKEAKGKSAQEYGKVLNDYFEDIYKKQSPKILLKQIQRIVNEFKIDMTTWISKEGITYLKLTNFKSNFIEKWEHELSMQEFIRLTEKVNSVYEELLEDYSFSKLTYTEKKIKLDMEKDIVNFTELENLIEETREHLLSFKLMNSAQVEKWSERHKTLLSNKKLELDSIKYKSEQKKSEIRELKVSFLDSLAQASQVDQLDFLLKKYLLILEGYQQERKTLEECEKFLREHYEEKFSKYILPGLITEIENSFNTSLNSITTLHSLDDLYESTIKKYSHPQCSVSIESINKLKKLYDEKLSAYIPDVISQIEIDFNNSKISTKNYNDLNDLFNSTIKRFSHPNNSLVKESIKKLKQIQFEFANEKGIAEYSAGNFKEAREWLDYSEQSDSTCQLYIGIIYMNHLNISYESTAVNWFKKAFNQGNVEATYQLAMCDDDSIDEHESKRLFEIAANQGHCESQIHLGVMYRFGSDLFPHVTRDDKKAIEWFTKAANQGDVNSMRTIGDMYSGNDDEEKAKEWYEKASNLGDESAQFSLAGIYYREKSFQKAFAQFEKCANQGNQQSQVLLTMMYMQGEGVQRNFKKAFEIGLLLANKNESYGQRICGFCYLNGHGVEKDLKLAKEYFEKAAKNGCATAKSLLQKHFQ